MVVSGAGPRATSPGSSNKQVRPSSSASASLICQRCMQPLQLDESLSDDALQASAASSSSSNDGGLTKSKYDVIASILPKDLAIPRDGDDRGSASAALPRIRDPHLRAAVAEHYSRPPSARPMSRADLSSEAKSSSFNSLSSQIALHARLFDLVSSYAPSTPATFNPYTTDASQAPKEIRLGLDHPLCRDCSDFCIDVMRRHIELARRQRDAFIEWHREADRSRGDEEEVNRMDAEIVELEELVNKTTASLYSSEQTRLGLEEELRQMDLEERALEQQETDFWNSYSKLLSETNALEATRESLLRSIHTSQMALARLNATNVFFDAFCIGHEGSGGGTSSEASSSRKRTGGSGLATINGLRFGRVSLSHSRGSGGASSSSTVDWHEVNAAWGQVALLVENLRVKISALVEGTEPTTWTAGPGQKRLGREFKGWRVHPKGSTSYMDKLSSVDATGQSLPASMQSHVTGATSASDSVASTSMKDPHELHHPNAWASLTRLLHLRRFDAAMVGVLDCTAQLYRWAEEAELRRRKDRRHDEYGGVEAPRMIHVINGEKIGDVNIRLTGTFITEESWSRALKYLLVNLQVLMNWATRDETVVDWSSLET